MTYEEQRQEKRLLWEDRLADFMASNKSAASWCQQQNIPEHQLYYWKQKLLDKEPTPKQSSSTRWVTIENKHQASGSGVSFRIGSVALEVERDFDPQVLADVVRALRDLC